MKQVEYDITKKAEEYINNISSNNYSEEENLINKCLGVLIQDGLYSYFLFLMSKEKLRLKGISFNILSNNTNTNKYISDLENLQEEILTDLDEIFLSREILERFLTYIRFMLKSKKDGGE